MSIENQATFYYKNVCDYEKNIESDFVVESIINGFTEFSNLLRTIYRDWRSYEISTVLSERTKIGIMTDDLENYHNLTDTLNCLYALATVGELCSEGENQYLNVTKSIFKSEYKKSTTFPFTMLEKYGFYFLYLKGNKEIMEYKHCDIVNIYYENSSVLIKALKFLAERLAMQDKKKEMAKSVAFMLADYDFILTGKINQNPLQKSILSTLGSLNGLWEKLVNVIQDECSLVADSSFNPYVFPNRTVTFKQNKKTICKFDINVDHLNIRLPLSFQVAKELIKKRKYLPKSINRNIDLFGCVGCGKCFDKNNIEIIEGIPLCNLPYSNFVTEDSRCLRLDITNEDEIKVICDLIKQSL